MRHCVWAGEGPLSGCARRVHESLTWLTGPPSGAMAARDSVTSFRNDELVQALDDFFRSRHPADPVPFFTTVVFERPGTVGINCYLTAPDKDTILHRFITDPDP